MSPQRKTVQVLSENGHLHAIPGDFILPEEERCNLKDRPVFSTTGAALEIPLIDMDDVAQDQPGAGDRHSELLQQVRTACAEWGFFQVKNHGVPLSVMTQMQQVVHEFLELPPEEKNKVSFTNPEGVTIEEGYTSRQGMSEGAISMWSDRLRYTMFPMSTRNCDLWPKNPSRFR
jgi:hypothetical protein